MAINVSTSVNKGERIMVNGKIKVRDWDNGERNGTSVEIDADALGHDLTWGNSAFTRTVLTREIDPEEPAEVEKELVDA